MKNFSSPVTPDLRPDESGSRAALIPGRRGLTMKLRNMLAAVLLMCQCGCGHTYFAWNNPLPVDQTDPYCPPSPGLLDWRGAPLWGNDLFGNTYDRRSSKEYLKDMERGARQSLHEYIRKH